MKRHATVVCTSALLTVALSCGVLFATAQTPQGANVILNTKLDAAASTELVQLVLDFAPGAFTPSHTHGGLGYVSVLEGEITVREAGKEQKYKVGESWKELPGVYAEVGNAAATPARVMATFLLPKGAALTTTHTGTTNAQLPPGPTTVARSNFDLASLPSSFNLHQLVMEFPANSFTPEHTHGGVGFVTVLSGQMLVRDKNGEKTFKTGETWREMPGEYAVVGNAGTTPARVAVTFLVPAGSALTTNR
ncbi:cupin domain-containing protein [Deinococcus peraridilitoris]|uniref:Cupin domain-containing protein n=1 Tax=Deinococcus peraridilitoris (strain DSM 19664 / LMG 22246 / CIP 109416 / KR-200) TaxID=937777 RepID=K9ZYX3_DEIPD|nr:cupin domain-containing protein [Deinococcus peraridilitoris]AFZ66853.1 cupin domain-containing protein [Deinococcus peraridilitoris DSM 19664]